MGFGSVNSDGNLRAGRTQLLKETSVGSDPEIIFCDFHLLDKLST